MRFTYLIHFKNSVSTSYRLWYASHANVKNLLDFNTSYLDLAGENDVHVTHFLSRLKLFNRRSVL